MDAAATACQHAARHSRAVISALPCSGGIFGESYASCGRVANLIPVDTAVPGCPPSPSVLLRGILAATGNAGHPDPAHEVPGTDSGP